jgi:hypothetical protein
MNARVTAGVVADEMSWIPRDPRAYARALTLNRMPS